MAEGFFRSKKGFTVVQNEITRDTTISLKAKGLYLVIQAYITMPDKKRTKDDFMRLAKEGNKAFDSAWKELKESGYLKVHIMSDNGRWRTEYELLDEPEAGPHTLYHNADGEVTSDNVRRAEKKQKSLLSEGEKNHYPKNINRTMSGKNEAKTMNYNEFMNYVKVHVADYLPEKFANAEITISQTIKNNDVVLDGLTIHNPDSNISPNIYLNSFYEEYQQGRYIGIL